ncbi:hypothetical protein ZWY2020_039361 [Hordeum vulgare]|nr:hypothetical protein ZWY2020_039361 [Hordeum vulgare]
MTGWGGPTPAVRRLSRPLQRPITTSVASSSSSPGAVSPDPAQPRLLLRGECSYAASDDLPRASSPAPMGGMGWDPRDPRDRDPSPVPEESGRIQGPRVKSIIVDSSGTENRPPSVRATHRRPAGAPSWRRSAWGTSRSVTWRWSSSKISSASNTWCCSTIGEGVLNLDGGEDASWVPDLYGGVGGSASVLDQAVFAREEEMEDVERPAMDLTDANGGSKH